MSFSKKVVVVTGASAGIGQCIAISYAMEKARVVIADIDEKGGQKTLKTIVAAGGSGIFARCDVREPADIESLFGLVVKEYGRVDILINNAGVSRWCSPYDLKVEEWDDIINTNLRSVFLCSREAARIMKEGIGGSIVNIASTRALMSEPGTEAYAATKGGILALTHALAVSLSEDNIQVNCISPGWIETGDYKRLRDVDHKQHLSGRVGKPVDIARACLYLTAPGNDFVNGENIVIDGGMTRKMIYHH